MCVPAEMWEEHGTEQTPLSVGGDSCPELSSHCAFTVSQCRSYLREGGHGCQGNNLNRATRSHFNNNLGAIIFMSAADANMNIRTDVSWLCAKYFTGQSHSSVSHTERKRM